METDINDQLPDTGNTATATVFIAAPEAFKRIAITGVDTNLGGWKKPKGNFTFFMALDHGLCIYKGQVPVPSIEQSPFKFVSANPDGKGIQDYEGKTQSDDRRETLLPDSWHFFILKDGDQSFFRKYMGMAADFWKGKSKEKLHQDIVSRFLCSAIIETQSREGSLEDRLEFLLDCFSKVWKVSQTDKNNCWEDAVNRLFYLNPDPSMEKFFWLTVAPNQSGTENLPRVVTNFAVLHAQQYSLFLDDLLRRSVFRRIRSRFHGILKRFAVEAGQAFWWIVFRIDLVPMIPKHPEEWVNTIVQTMASYPGVLFGCEKAASAAIKFLVGHSPDYDALFERIAPFPKRNQQYTEFFYQALKRSFLAKRSGLNDSIEIMKSRFVAAFYEDLALKNSEVYVPELDNLVEELFSLRTVSDNLRLLIQTPEFLEGKAEATVLKILETKGKISYMWDGEFAPLAQLEGDERLRRFPKVHEKLLDLLSSYALPLVQKGALSKIPSLTVTLMAIGKTRTILFLSKPDFDALCRVLASSSLEFFVALKETFMDNPLSYQQLRQHRNGKLRNIADKIERHFQAVQELVGKIKTHNILLREIRTLGPKVSAYLLQAGLKNKKLQAVKDRVAQLRDRHQVISELVTTVGRFGEVELLDYVAWGEFLKSTNVDSSEEDAEDIALSEAVQFECPVPLDSARWLLKVSKCQLFQDKVWTPLIQSLEDTPLDPGELAKLIDVAGDCWMQLARSVSAGTMTFADMEKLETLDNDKHDLMTLHLKGDKVGGVLEVYRDFRSLRDIGHSIAPFIAALRIFRIRDRQPINALYDYIRNNVLQRWEGTTVQEVRKTALLEIIHQRLRVDPDQPQSKATIKFISSLVEQQTDGSFTSPLLTWLRDKTEKDMQAMGRILQGNLLEAYGMLQTLNTRIAPFLQQDFGSYEDLLTAITESERRFAQERSQWVRPVKVKFLVQTLREIDAAVKAAVISPVEDAKEKLRGMAAVFIEIENDQLLLKVFPSLLSLDELQQAYQLLEMAAGDEGLEVQEEAVVNARRYVPQILRLFAVSHKLFTAGWMLYRLPSFVVKMSGLEQEIKRLELHLKDWLDHWSKIAEMPMLSVFPRDYLLHMADRILHNEVDEVVGVMQIFLPQAIDQLEAFAAEIVRKYGSCQPEATHWLSTKQLYDIISLLHNVVCEAAQRELPLVKLPAFLEQYGRILNSFFVDRAVQIFNVARELVVGSAIAAYLAVTRKSIDPRRILFVTRHTTAEEVTRFTILWANADPLKDFFVMAHIERLGPDAASAVRDNVVRVLQDRRPKLLLLAQHQHQVHVTKSIAARLGLIADRTLEVNFTASQLRDAFKQLLPCSSSVRFFVSKLPGCGKTQRVLQWAAEEDGSGRRRSYYRIPIRSASVEDLLSSLNRVGEELSKSSKEPQLLHLDVAQCTSPEFNDIILSLLIYGALFDPKRPRLGFWTLSCETMLAVELASPLSSTQFPIVDLLGELVTCECEAMIFNYHLAGIPRSIEGKVYFEAAVHLIFAAQFLELRTMGHQGIHLWDQICEQPETCFLKQVEPMRAFDLFLLAFQKDENRAAPTYTSINSLALFLYRHITAMTTSHWFNHDAALLFDNTAKQQAALFKTDVFRLLAKVASDTVARSLSLKQVMRDVAETHVEEWPVRQRALLLLGVDETGQVLGVNIVGRDEAALKAMFHRDLLPILDGQGIRFQQLGGFGNLLSNPNGADVVVNAMRSLLLLDGTQSSLEKVRRLDSQDRRISAVERLEVLTGRDLGYVLTGDNLTKMMFALYRIRCGLPVIAFGEAGVGKSALFRFLFHTLLGHQFRVCNVNSGTTVADITELVEDALSYLKVGPKSEVFLFFDEMNTADVAIIALLKEMMLDGHYNGVALPKAIHFLGAANPYRYQVEGYKEAAVGLVFQFTKRPNEANGDMNRLVYRVNPLPLAMYDHVYDFGHLCNESEATYIHEICRYHLKDLLQSETINSFAETLVKSHQETRGMSSDPPSSVSLRDATRAATLFRWFLETQVGKMLASSNKVAQELTVYLAYAFRFEERGALLAKVFGNTDATRSVMQASEKLTRMLYDKAHGATIGAGAIALNTALCENLFALFVCVLNGIFVIIVGRPGTSKSLSVEILKLVLSAGNHTLRQELGGLPALTELYFQCSPLLTSSGFRALFDSAQRLSTDAKLMMAMVVLDELGLADQSPEKPIKVLHAELERKAVLTSGETEGAPYSVVALSNWVVDAAQVNRGILVRRQQASDKDLRKDLLKTAKELALSLLKEHTRDGEDKDMLKELDNYLDIIGSLYASLDANKEIGGGHFYSMRDFFFCVKNFVCSVLSSTKRKTKCTMITDNHIIKSVVRNFGGHRMALVEARSLVTELLEVSEGLGTRGSPIELVIDNIMDSTKKMSIHIARHLMILNKSLIGLQLLNKHVKDQLNGKLEQAVGWHVLFGPCFPEDLQFMSVTRKLRQVEQAIRAGGVLILCHADQLFESLYMVLNQQYWAQGDVTMTQIALGPSIRAIALPNGPFRIIALQDTHRALNRQAMSPAILSRFEKHELNARDILNEDGERLLSQINQDPLWLIYVDIVHRQGLLYGYHEDSFAALALSLQEQTGIADDASQAWMKALNPMELIRVEAALEHNAKVLERCQKFRDEFVLDNILEALDTVKSKRLVIMTNTLRHVEVDYGYPCTVIRLFELQSELQLVSRIEEVLEQGDRNQLVIVHHDAVSGPIEQFQFAKYELERRFSNSGVRLVFVVHVDPRPANINWVFSFGDRWEYIFVDDVVPVSQTESIRLPLKTLVKTSSDGQNISGYISDMTEDMFKTLLLELLGPSMQLKLATLGSGLGQFFSGVRSALGLAGNSRLIQLLKECLVAQLESKGIRWNVVNAVCDAHFDSSSSLSDALWSVFKNKLVLPLAHLLIISDVWRVSDPVRMDLWCSFIEALYPDGLLAVTSDGPVQIPAGFRLSTQPFGRLMSTLENSLRYQNDPLTWLFRYIRETANSWDLTTSYFRDWLLLRTAPHLHACVQQLPLDSMLDLVGDFYQSTDDFLKCWAEEESAVIAALELLSITQSAKGGQVDWGSYGIRNWTRFKKATVQASLDELCRLMNTRRGEFVQSVTSIEISEPLRNLLNDDDDEEVSNKWLGLRIAKLVLLFDEKIHVKPSDLRRTTGDKLITYVTSFVIESVITPRFAANRGTRLTQTDLHTLLECQSSAELSEALVQCPVTKHFLLERATRNFERCPSCKTFVVNDEQPESAAVQHLGKPDEHSLRELLQKYQEFFFFFERVAEIFVEHFQDKENQLESFLNKLVDNSTKLRVSWRFLTVIVRAVLSTEHGVKVMNKILAPLHCNNPQDLNANGLSLLQALLYCADEDARRGEEDRQPLQNDDPLAAAMLQTWTVERIQQVAALRRHWTTCDTNGAVSALNHWARWSKNSPDQRAIADLLLFFILRLVSDEGDETKLVQLLRDPQLDVEISSHCIVGPYLEVLSPISLGFRLLPAGGTVGELDSQLTSNIPVTLGGFQLRREVNAERAPYLARLALHVSHIAQVRNIGILRALSTSAIAASRSYLPGINKHPFLESFLWEPERWYICTCGYQNVVGNCGNLVVGSICASCGANMGAGMHVAAQGVRLAQEFDFEPPLGFFTEYLPTTTPTYAVRNTSPVVTRLSMLLTSLSIMAGVLEMNINDAGAVEILRTLPRVEQKPEHRGSRELLQLLSTHAMIHLKVFLDLLYGVDHRLTVPDQFRLFHLLLHKVIDFESPCLGANATVYTTSPQARENFEAALTDLLNGASRNLLAELQQSKEVANESTRKFHEKVNNNDKEFWAYERHVFSDRQSIQSTFARNPSLSKRYPFVDLLLDEEVWARKLAALEHFGDVLRFLTVVRTTLQRNITYEEALKFTIGEGLRRIFDSVAMKPVILDRGRCISTEDEVLSLFEGTQKLWSSFSQLANGEGKTFLEHFECQQVDLQVRPSPTLKETAPLVLVLAGCSSPEAVFVVQLLAHAIEAAAAVAARPSVQPYCRKNSGRVKLSCASSSSLADFDESLYAHVPIEQVDQFFINHAIDVDSLPLAESFARVAVIGVAGSTIAEDLVLEQVPDFIFKNSEETENYMLVLEREFLAWQPESITPDLSDSILDDLEKNRSLPEARSLLLSVIQHALQTTEPLLIHKVRRNYVFDVIQELLKSEIITNRHVSQATLNAFHKKLEICQALGLVKAINRRMRGDDIFGGRVPDGWKTMLPAHLVEETRAKLRKVDVLDSFLQLAKLVSDPGSDHAELEPKESLLNAIRQYEGGDFVGIPADVRMEHLGHVLAIAETLVGEK